MKVRGRGFTLVEMLVVMAILAILAAYIASVLFGGNNGRIKRTRSQISLLETALDAYRDEFGSYPPDTGYGLDMEAGTDTYDAGSLWRHLILRVKNVKTGEIKGPFLSVWPQKDLREYADAAAGASFYLTDPWGQPYGFVGDRKRVLHNPGGFEIFSPGPNGQTASDDAPAEPNLAYDGLDNDGNGTIDDTAELGAAARNGSDDDDISSWSAR
jgi:prepilin-type N-terminal cleavage/methylation domain-containing protein